MDQKTWYRGKIIGHIEGKEDSAEIRYEYDDAVEVCDFTSAIWQRIAVPPPSAAASSDAIPRKGTKRKSPSTSSKPNVLLARIAPHNKASLYWTPSGTRPKKGENVPLYVARVSDHNKKGLTEEPQRKRRRVDSKSANAK